MVTAGCMALCFQIDNPACEAQDNYRGVGGGQQSFILPLPTDFWLTGGKARQWELVEAALAAAAHGALLLPTELWGWHCWSSWVVQCSLLHPAGAAFPCIGCVGLPGSGIGKTRLRWRSPLGGEY